MNDLSRRANPIISEFASDSEMHELIRMFVDELPQRIDEFRTAWSDSDAAEVKRLAHQLKGAAPGYGFTPLGTAAHRLEVALEHAQTDLSSVRDEFEALIQLCSRAAC